MPLKIYAAFAAGALAMSAANAQDAAPPQHWSAAVVAGSGLEAAEAALSARGQESTRDSDQERAEGTVEGAADAFALAGVRFLRGVERALQARYHVAAGDVGYAPVLRLPIPRNPDPAAFEDDTLETLLRGLIDDMAGVRSALADAQTAETAEGGPDWGATFDIAAVWLDIDGNGERTPDGRESESLLRAGAAAGLRVADTNAAVLVRFDAADAAWLEAYAHLISAFAEFALALDPTAATARARPGWEAAERFDGRALERGEFGAWADQAAILLHMLQAQPDPERIRAAHAHLRAMVAANARFWELVEAETDDRLEWIPNAAQTSAWGGVRIDAETSAAWRGVLKELDAVLTGELLIPHWRYAGPGGWPVGVDLTAYVDAPSPLDPVGWTQGAAAAPYLREGPVVDGEALTAFASFARGDAFWLALWLN